ncbi:betaine--homocysteine S-methyltransferase 1 [Lingula anatina]|uniref:Betaine--homocysteine S-methyltransferase 1 n=1 Tax=Lingula anatina TaxID=7574 RepID=A0A1S3HMC6_LINAN|nr:betaine--homocysteine S-methyltransferase 1 [Lingula anatina]|eukprot:XP_013387238.1 betaine--homocysteine S-methyltransferase 1 [Lingula anatina]
MAERKTKRGLVERLQAGENILVAEGYLFELERRGYLEAGEFVPEVVLENPDVVRQIQKEFVHAGSDVVLAFTYFGYREKLKRIGREEDLEKLNRTALKMAREVADESGTLMAGNISNSTIYDPDNPEVNAYVKEMFKEQVVWAVEEGADYIVGETYRHFGEAMLALEAIKEFGQGVPAVITMVAYKDKSVEGVPIPEAMRRLQDAGAAVVGLNCGRGPATTIPMMREIKKACKGAVGCLPVCYRTTPDKPVMQAFYNPDNDSNPYYDLPAWLCSRSQIGEYAAQAREIGIQYIGLCCGNAPHYFRIVAETYGRRPPASRYSSSAKTVLQNNPVFEPLKS